GALAPGRELSGGTAVRRGAVQRDGAWEGIQMSARSIEESIVVINAGSSSLKFSLFLLRESDLALDLRGQIEGIGTAPLFVARDASGRMVAERSWGEELGHDGAVEHVRAFLRERLAGDRLVGVGHRVVHGGLEYAAPIRVDR